MKHQIPQNAVPNMHPLLFTSKGLVLAIVALVSSTSFSPRVVAATPDKVPLPKQPINVQYSFEKDGIKNRGKLKNFLGKVMGPSMENTKLTYRLNGAGLDITLKNSRGDEEDVKFSCRTEMDPSGSVTRETQGSGKELEVMEATVKTIQFIGRSKAVKWYNQDDLERRKKDKAKASAQDDEEADDGSRESLIDPDEIITTLLQIPVWASTIRGDLKKQGVPFRLCLRGDPIQMRLSEGRSESKDEVVYTCERVATRGGEQSNTDALFTLTYDRGEMTNGFVMPRQMKIHVGGLEMRVSRDSGNK